MFTFIGILTVVVFVADLIFNKAEAGSAVIKSVVTMVKKAIGDE